MDNLKEALEYIAELGVEAERTEVLEIGARTYANKNLVRYDKQPKATPVVASTLTALIDYVSACYDEFPCNMIVHIVNPTKVKLMSALDFEREREVLFEVNAQTSEFKFDHWFDQERFMIELQANFQPNEDLKAVMKLAGNIEKKNEQQFADDGLTQIATICMGVATKAAAAVPNPVELIPYRTFQEVKQPSSKFVFRIGDNDRPEFKLVEAEGGIWKNEAIDNIKEFFINSFETLDTEVKARITVIG